MQLQGQNSNLKCNISIEYYYNHWNAEKRDVIVSSEMWIWYEHLHMLKNVRQHNYWSAYSQQRIAKR